MKKFFLIIFAALQVTAVAARQDDPARPWDTKTFDAAQIKSLRASTSGGSLSVEGGNGKEARVEIFVRSNNGSQNLSEQEIRERLNEYYDLEVSVAGNQLKAIASTKKKMNWKKGLSIAFKIYVPTYITSNLQTSGGSIHINNLTGDQTFSTSGGSLHVDAINGQINGRTSGGSIHVSDSKGTITLQTSGGSIEAVGCNGTLSLATSGGSLKLQNLSGNVKATTSGGGVRGENIEGELLTHTSGGSIKLEQLSCSLDASTSAGSVYAAFTNPGKSVKISVSAGSATIALPKDKGVNLDLAGMRIHTGTLNNFNGSVEKDNVKGSLNGGGPTIYVRSSSGSVSLEWL